MIRFARLTLVFVFVALGVGCAIEPQSVSQLGLSRTPAARAVVVAGKSITATPGPFGSQISTDIIPSTPTPTDTPTLLMVPVAQLTLPPKTPTPTGTPLALPSGLKGKIAFKSDRLEGEDIFVMDPDGSNVALLTNRWAYQSALERDTRTMDGNRLAFVRGVDNPPDSNQIFYVDLITKKEYQVTNVTRTASAWDPAWSPQGNRIAFTSNYIKGDRVFIINADGSGQVEIASNPQEWDHHPSWSPDGSQIVFASNRSGWQQIWLMKTDGSGVQNISPWHDWNDWDPVWIKW